MARRGWQSLQRAMALAGQLPHDLSLLMRKARRSGLQLHFELAHLRRVGDQIDRAASRLSLALLTAAMIVGSSIVMTVDGGPRLFGLPAFGVLGFSASVIGALALAIDLFVLGEGHSPSPPQTRRTQRQERQCRRLGDGGPVHLECVGESSLRIPS